MPAPKPRRPRPKPPSQPKRATVEVAEQIPIGVWVRWSAREHRVLYDQERRYGIPIGRRTIDLPAVARWIHDVIASGKLRASEDEGPAGDSSPALERQRAAKAELYELDLAERRSELVQRSEVIRSYTLVADELRALAQDIERQYGGDAQGRVISAIDRMILAFGRELEAAQPPAPATTEAEAHDDADE